VSIDVTVDRDEFDRASDFVSCAKLEPPEKAALSCCNPGCRRKGRLSRRQKLLLLFLSSSFLLSRSLFGCLLLSRSFLCCCFLLRSCLLLWCSFLLCSFLLGHSTSSVKKGLGRVPSRRLPSCLQANESSPTTKRKPLLTTSDVCFIQ
jgi:hypothetical protein